MLLNDKNLIISAFALLLVAYTRYHHLPKTFHQWSHGHMLSQNPLLATDSKQPLVYSDGCLDKHYTKRSVKKAYEMPFAALFEDTRGERKFEASSIFKHDDGYYYAICDNSWAISRFSSSLTPFSKDNVMIGDPSREKEEESGYEAIFAHGETFYVVRESIKHDNSKYHAIIEELFVGEDDYKINAQCKCEFEFEGDSKGFEGAFGFPGVDGEFYLVGLCEGNNCLQKEEGENKGNGRMVMMMKSSTKSECLWKTVKMIHIPPTAYFTDYSDISVTADGRVAITSQVDSAIWFGQLLGIKDGVLDPDSVEFDSLYSILNFPKSNACQTVYCNIEGVTFMNNEMIMAVSDKMKSKGRQPHYCLEKDQSIHAFVLPKMQYTRADN